MTPSTPILSFDELPDLWKRTYAPISEIDNSIYSNIMSLPSLEEWTSLLQSLKKDKAPGPSQITNEMLQHLGPILNNFFMS